MSKDGVSSYVPTWVGPVEGYATNQTVRNLWRVARTHDRDDLMQEARIVFLRCERRYPVIDTPQHFMALFKTALKRRIDELSNKSSSTWPNYGERDDDEGAAFDREPIGELENAGFLAALIRQAPREVALVLRLFLDAPGEMLSLAEDAWRQQHRGKDKDDLNAMVRRLLGNSVGDDPVGLVRSYFVE